MQPPPVGDTIFRTIAMNPKPWRGASQHGRKKTTMIINIFVSNTEKKRRVKAQGI